MSPNITWETVRKLVDECLFYLPDETQFNIGPFLLDKQFPDSSLAFIQEKESRWTRIDFPTEQTGLSEMMLLVGDKKIIYSVSSTVITQEPFYFGVKHPYFQYHWKNENGTGRLIFLRVDLDLDTFVSYEEETGFEAKIFGDKELCTQLPKSLIDVAEILGHSVPHFINYQEKIQKIFELSQLKEFVAECKNGCVYH